MNRSPTPEDTSPCALPIAHAEWRVLRICLDTVKEICCTFLCADWISLFHLQWCGNIDSSKDTETQYGWLNPVVGALIRNRGGTATSEKDIHCCFPDAFWPASLLPPSRNQRFYSGSRFWVHLPPCLLGGWRTIQTFLRGKPDSFW